MQICDTHQHLWDLSRFSLPWTTGHPVFDQSFLFAEYEAASAGLGIEKTVYMEVDLAPQQRLAELEQVRRWCEQHDNRMVAAVVAAEPGALGFAEHVEVARSVPYVRGLRRILHGEITPPGHCLRPEFIADIQRLAEYDLSFDVCIRAAELPDAARLIEACPGVSFILDHCGNADVRADPAEVERWRDGIRAAAERPNVVCKVSGFIWTVRDRPWSVDEHVAPVVEHVRGCFGTERLMFGGDWPVCTQSVSLAEWVNALRQAVSTWPEAEQRALFYDNAAQFYRLG